MMRPGRLIDYRETTVSDATRARYIDVLTPTLFIWLPRAYLDDRSSARRCRRYYLANRTIIHGARTTM